MPLARIITEHAEESLELAIQLRSRGFEVETVPPGQVPDTPADLEIQLDACGADQILEQVMGASADEDLHIFVAPGALDESFSSQPIRLAPPTFKRSPVETPHQFAEVASVASVDAERDQSNHPTDVPSPGYAEMEPPEPVAGRFDFGQVEIETNRVQVVQGAGEYPAAVHGDTSVAGPEIAGATTLTVFEASELPQSQAEPTLSIPESRKADAKSKASSLRPADNLFLRVAILAAALAAAVVVVGSVWQQRHPAAGTLPSNGSQQIPFQKAQGQNSSGQKSPEQKTTEQNPPQVSTTSSPASAPVTSATPAPASGTVHTAQTPPPATPQAVTTPRPAEVKASARPPQHVSAKKPTAKKKTPPAQHHSVHTGDSGLIAKDTVVYYNRKGTTPAPSANASTKQ